MYPSHQHVFSVSTHRQLHSLDVQPSLTFTEKNFLIFPGRCNSTVVQQCVFVCECTWFGSARPGPETKPEHQLRRLFSMALADPGAGVTEFSRTDKHCPFKSCHWTQPVCLCVCVFQYNDPKHSLFLHCNQSITFEEMNIRFSMWEKERETHKISLSCSSHCYFAEIITVCFHSLTSHEGETMIWPLIDVNY